MSGPMPLDGRSMITLNDGVVMQQHQQQRQQVNSDISVRGYHRSVSSAMQEDIHCRPATMLKTLQMAPPNGQPIGPPPQVPPPPPPSSKYQTTPLTTPISNISSNNTANAMFRVQMWSNNYDSGVHSLNHSSAQSLLSVSSLRAGSQISTISDDGHSRLELTDQQQLKFENIPPNLGRGSQDGEIRNAIPELIHLLSDEDEFVVQRAATMVQNIAIMDSEQPPYSEPRLRASEVIPSLKNLLRIRSNSQAIIKPTLGALFQISERRDGLESLLRLNEQTKGELLVDIIQHIKFTGGSAIRYAILTFHTMIADKSTSKDAQNIEIARGNGALCAVTQFLDRETNEKLLSVIVECVRLLCDRSQLQKASFLQLNGPVKLFHILRNLRYEGLLWRTTQLLKILSNADPQSIVNCGGYDVLHAQLDHASQRLILSTLECIRNMSDVPAKNMDISPLLSKLLQLLGAMDPIVVLYCTGILSNLLANNQMNKEFLFNRGAISTLYRVLINSYGIPANTPSQQQRVEDLQERALATLRHLCVGHVHQAEAQKSVFQHDYAADFLLRKLTEMRPAILKQTLQILNKAALQDSNLNIFRDIRLRMASDSDTSFVERIVLVLKVACEQLPSTQVVEEIRVADLIHLSMSTLQLLCRDAHLLNQISYHIRKPENVIYHDSDCAASLPVFCLYQSFIEDENLKRSALGLISELSSHPEIAAIHASDNSLMSAFLHYSRSRNQAFATYAEQAYERSLQGGNPALLCVISVQATGTPNTGATSSPNRSVNGGVAVSGSGHCGQPYMQNYPAPQQQQLSPTHNQSYYSGINYGLSTNSCNQHSASTTMQQYIQQTPMPSSIGGQYVSPDSVSQLDPHIQPMPLNGQQNHHPAVCGHEGSSDDAISLQNSMDYISSDWPEDLSGLSISDDPFATMFTQQFDLPQPRQQHVRHNYPSGVRSHINNTSTIFCNTGQSNLCDQPMESGHMGSPEAPGSWHDSLNSFVNHHI